MRTRHVRPGAPAWSSLLLFLAALLSGPLETRAQQFQWADAIYDPADTGGAWLNAAALDATGTAYVSFGCLGDVRFGDTTYQALTAQPRAFLVQYRAGGTRGWVKPGITAAHLLTDAAGDVYATGTFSGTLIIDGFPLTATGTDYFVARWSRNGTLRWAVQGGAAGDRSPARLALDANGSVYLTGQFSGESGFGGVTLTPTGNPSPGASSAFVLRLNGVNGAVVWAVGTANAAGSTATSRGLRVGVDQTGNVYVVGVYAGGSGAGIVVFPAPAGTAEQLFWLKINAGSVPLAARALPLPAPGTEPGFAVDATGHGYLANTFKDSLDLGGRRLLAGGDEDAYIARFDPNGVLQWATQLGGTTPLDLTDATDLALDAQGRVMVAGFFQGQAASGTVVFGAPFHPTLNNDLDAYLATFDQLTGTPVWALTGGGGATEEGSRLAVGPTGNVLLLGRSLSDTARFGGAQVGAAGLTNSPKVFVAHSLSGHNTLRGRVFVDTDGDGSQDAGEAGYPGGVVVRAAAGATATTTRSRPDGTYEAIVGVGTFTTTLPTPPLYHTVVSSGPATTSFPSTGDVGAGTVYALQPIAGQTDVQVLLTQRGRARAGRLVPYQLTYRNVGTTIVATGRVVLTFESRLNYLSSTPAAARAGTTLTWIYANLLPGQTRTLDVLFSLPTTAALGDSIRCVARIEPLTIDVQPGDNVAATRRVVTGSADPNHLAVNLTEMTTRAVGGGEWLQYTAYFQNLGTDTAFSILPLDSLPTRQLNLATLQPMTWSHECTWWQPDARGILKVEFINIQLPPQIDDAIRSNGHLVFRARPLPWLAVGERIRNRTLLYFDYNAAVPTNTVSTLVTGVTGLPDGSPLAAPAVVAAVWPNPATDHLTVEGWLPDAGPLTVRLLNTRGQPVYVSRSPRGGTVRHTLDVSAVPAGLYLIELHCGATRLSQRVVIN
ncbi:MAG: T9SS type A sorting domain-containing protein [Hymenobacteraceae bacterium]|nr:T9SS type A sorting domain-containing protein [Hymenobacteraceae bacterium]